MAAFLLYKRYIRPYTSKDDISASAFVILGGLCQFVSI